MSWASLITLAALFEELHGCKVLSCWLCNIAIDVFWSLSGLIDLKEFIVGLCNVGNEARDNKVKFAFQIFDLDGSGYIDVEELKKIVKVSSWLVMGAWATIRSLNVACFPRLARLPTWHRKNSWIARCDG